MVDYLQELSDTFLSMLQDLIRFIPSLFSALIIFILGLILARVVSAGLSRALARRSAGTQVTELLTKIAYWTVITLLTITALQQVRVNLTAFLTGLGIVGFTVGFALQDVSKNFVSGLLLLVQQPFHIGEAVEVAGFSGTVIAVNLRATELRTFDGRVVLIPNADIFTSPIINFSRGVYRRLDIELGVPYDSNLQAVRNTVLEAIRSVQGVLEDPPPQTSFQDFGDFSIRLMVNYWVDTAVIDVVSAKDAGIRAVKLAFDQAQIEFPSTIQAINLNRSQTIQD